MEERGLGDRRGDDAGNFNPASSLREMRKIKYYEYMFAKMATEERSKKGHGTKSEDSDAEEEKPLKSTPKASSSSTIQKGKGGPFQQSTSDLSKYDKSLAPIPASTTKHRQGTARSAQSKHTQQPRPADASESLDFVQAPHSLNQGGPTELAQPQEPAEAEEFVDQQEPTDPQLAAIKIEPDTCTPPPASPSAYSRSGGKKQRGKKTKKTRPSPLAHADPSLVKQDPDLEGSRIESEKMTRSQYDSASDNDEDFHESDITPIDIDKVVRSSDNRRGSKSSRRKRQRKPYSTRRGSDVPSGTSSSLNPNGAMHAMDYTTRARVISIQEAERMISLYCRDFDLETFANLVHSGQIYNETEQDSKPKFLLDPRRIVEHPTLNQPNPPPPPVPQNPLQLTFKHLLLQSLAN
ncbi:hypothetical protein BdWA1_001632 [Babesia duncani]|uniref:Uncharacterized protein n=1 Tax=Babesia duncani TaxID=323732 RepID=A0AAD9UNT8_9APIC|nr:hypothetical protein BdWA1_001632 [Babesia duncani]